MVDRVGGSETPHRSQPSRAYVPRLLDPLIAELLRQLPALFLAGPRATGKTTTASRHAATVVRLDDPGEATAIRSDPDAVLRGLDEPVLLDEWQAVPSVLGAVKRSVDTDPRPGRFILTGSVGAVRASDLWPAVGRLIRLPMYGMTVREQNGSVLAPAFLDRIADGADFPKPANAPDLRGYVEIALRSGFPEPALHQQASVGQRWLESYAEHVVVHDIKWLERSADPQRLSRYLEALALNTAGVVEDKTVYDAAGLNRATARAYDEILEGLFFAEQLPAWSSNRLKRLVRSTKRYVVDAGLVGAVLRMDVNGILRDGDLLGRLLDTFVTSQLRAELPICSSRPRLYHLRQEQGRREIDLIAELGGGRVIGIEIKADASPRPEGVRHLAWLRDTLGDVFVAGVLLHTGRHSYQMADKITALPIASLWS